MVWMAGTKAAVVLHHLVYSIGCAHLKTDHIRVKLQCRATQFHNGLIVQNAANLQWDIDHS